MKSIRLINSYYASFNRNKKIFQFCPNFLYQYRNYSSNNSNHDTSNNNLLTNFPPPINQLENNEIQNSSGPSSGLLSSNINIFIKLSTSTRGFTKLSIPINILEHIADITKIVMNTLKLKGFLPGDVLLKDEISGNTLDNTLLIQTAIHQHQLYNNQKILVSIPENLEKKKESIIIPEYTVDNSMTNFANAVRLHSTISTYPDGDIIELSNTITWPDLDFNKLFIRKFYSHVVQNIMENFNNPTIRRYIILGAPGISKSGFGNYLLYCAIKLNKTIVYSNGKEKIIYLLRYNNQNNSYICTAYAHTWPVDIGKYLSIPTTIFIADSSDSPPAGKAFTIVITSPNFSRWKTFYNSHPSSTHRLVFNPLTRNEVLLLRKTCFPTISEELVHTKFNRWGGNARAIFEIPEDEDQSEFDQVLKPQVISIKILTNIYKSGLQQPSREIVHRALHLVTMGFAKDKFDETLFSNRDFYKFKSIQAASDEVAEYLRAKCNELSISALSNILHSSSKEVLQMFLKGRGEIFELYARDALKKGGTFRTFQLGFDSIHEEITIPRTKQSEIVLCNNLVEFASNYKVGQRNKIMFGVQKSNFPTIDTIFDGNKFGNMTINIDHTILLGNANKSDYEAGGLLQILNILKIDYTTTKIKFYWIVPSDIYMDWYTKRAKSSSFTLYDITNTQRDISKDKVINTSKTNNIMNITTGKSKFSIKAKYFDIVKNIEIYVMNIEFRY